MPVLLQDAFLTRLSIHEDNLEQLLESTSEIPDQPRSHIPSWPPSPLLQSGDVIPAYPQGSPETALREPSLPAHRSKSGGSDFQDLHPSKRLIRLIKRQV
jgi:hypothetical protein